MGKKRTEERGYRIKGQDYYCACQKVALNRKKKSKKVTHCACLKIGKGLNRKPSSKVSCFLMDNDGGTTRTVRVPCRRRAKK